MFKENITKVNRNIPSFSEKITMVEEKIVMF
jgi:hypothetical protein